MKPSSIVAWIAFVLGATLAVGRDATAAKPEDAPPESRAQVDVALRALAPAWAEPGRKLSPWTPGSLENAIRAFAPAKFHPVDEGALPTRRATLVCPEEMAAVGGRVCVDRWEGMLVSRSESGTEIPHSPYDVPDPAVRYVAKSRPNVVPQAFVSGSVAADACRAAGKRLCKPVEWRMACGGKDGTVYPYGPKVKPGACRDHGAAPMRTFHQDSAKRGWGLTEMNDPRLNRLDDTVAKTGTHAECVTNEGVFDMVGNLHEWTADTNGTFQGGFWLDTSQHGDGCAYRTIAHPFAYHDYSTGFRCCSDGASRDDATKADAGTGAGARVE